MAKAKITAEQGYRCAPDGHTVRVFACGDVVQGQVAEWALADKAARRIMDGKPRPKNKAMAPPENK